MRRTHRLLISLCLLFLTTFAQAERLPIFQTPEKFRLPVYPPRARRLLDHLPLPGSPAPDQPKRPWEKEPDPDPPDDPEPDPAPPERKPDPTPPSADPDPPDEEKK